MVLFQPITFSQQNRELTPPGLQPLASNRLEVLELNEGKTVLFAVAVDRARQRM